MKVREYLTLLLQSNRNLEMRAKDNFEYAQALKKEGAVELLESIFCELNKSQIMDTEIN